MRRRPIARVNPWECGGIPRHDPYLELERLCSILEGRLETNWVSLIIVYPTYFSTFITSFAGINGCLNVVESTMEELPTPLVRLTIIMSTVIYPGFVSDCSRVLQVSAPSKNSIPKLCQQSLNSSKPDLVTCNAVCNAAHTPSSLYPSCQRPSPRISVEI